MCMPMECPLCKKTTWRGCGQHVASVMANVPADQQCTCPRDQVVAAMNKH
ncbi:hypothetical protein AMAG_11287 [Allomyces macrogynus ATCC 38327]|uniref:Uncharacterized protein n=1 Tax=Allomyces macrogynus (strain ATCC 38327) TaxID=578462 RepID=A0A0L0SWE6_ALLM3|nr:hypothetical protein AMAG_11287 [Allomyces macrogynus ATCC 38327]|eukprot:KNE66796.1 hypothetical protein AMAG_11287 [Allomyces macrogynus ATCC 38327]